MRKIDRFRLALFSLSRNNRECPITSLIILCEIIEAGELSTLALDRRLRIYRIKNTRNAINRCQKSGFITRTSDVDGAIWHASPLGISVLMHHVEQIYGSI